MRERVSRVVEIIGDCGRVQGQTTTTGAELGGVRVVVPLPLRAD